MAENKCDTHEFRLGSLEKRTDKLEECQGDLKEKAVEFENSAKSAHFRLDNMEEQTKAILKLGIAVEQMTSEIKGVIENFKEHENRLDKLEQAPADTVMKYFKQIVGLLISAGVGYILSKIGG